MFSFIADILVVGADLFIPFLVHNLIQYMSNPGALDQMMIQSPWGLTGLIFFLCLFRSTLAAISDQEINCVQFQVKTALTGLIYEKALKISYKASLELSEGRILQMVTVDTYNVFNCVWRSFETVLTIGQVLYSML